MLFAFIFRRARSCTGRFVVCILGTHILRIIFVSFCRCRPNGVCGLRRQRNSFLPCSGHRWVGFVRSRNEWGRGGRARPSMGRIHVESVQRRRRVISHQSARKIRVAEMSSETLAELLVASFPNRSSNVVKGMEFHLIRKNIFLL